jgi:hypothetical protein
MASTWRYIAKFGIKPSEKRVEFHVAMCTLYIQYVYSTALINCFPTLMSKNWIQRLAKPYSMSCVPHRIVSVAVFGRDSDRAGCRDELW